MYDKKIVMPDKKMSCLTKDKWNFVMHDKGLSGVTKKIDADSDHAFELIFANALRMMTPTCLAHPGSAAGRAAGTSSRSYLPGR